MSIEKKQKPQQNTSLKPHRLEMTLKRLKREYEIYFIT